MGCVEKLKNVFKRILPPPVRSFMREVNNLNDSIWRSKGELSGQINAASRRVGEIDGKLNALQGDTGSIHEELRSYRRSLDKLNRLFESANRENLRLYREAHDERESLARAYAIERDRLVEDLAAAQREKEDLLARIDDLEQNGSALLACIQNVQSDLSAVGCRFDEAALQHHRDFDRIAGNLEGIQGAVRHVIAHQDELLDPELYGHAIKIWYQNQTGRPLDLANPVTYNEKVQWMKVFDRDPRKAILTDKVQVREWVARTIGEQYLIPLVGVYESAGEIDFNALPEAFVLKASHGSGWNIVVENREAFDADAVRRRADGWLRKNFAFVNGYEMHYDSIPRRLIVEHYMCNSDNDLPDYKFWCFGGTVYYIEYMANRRSGLKVAFFDTQWNKMPFTSGHTLCDEDIARPENLEEMISIAEKLARDFPHVRVDLYRLDDGAIKFGEMTFSSSSGVARWQPASTDAMLGALFELPKVNR